MGTRVGEHVRSRVHPDDILQETSTRAWESIRKLQWTGDDTFVRWLKGIARNMILKQLEQSHRHEIIYLREDLVSKDPSVGRRLRREERFGRLEEAVNRLPPDYREAVLLVRIEGLSLKEAAARMNRTPKAVAHVLSRALGSLRTLLDDTESLQLPPWSLEKSHDDVQKP